MQLEYVARNAKLVVRLTGKFNIIVGDSGSGKTLLAKMADRFGRADEGAVLKPKPIYSNVRQDITPFISNAHDSIIVIDEGFDFEWLHSCIPAMEKSNNYYIIVTRDGVAKLPYGVNNIFHVKQNGIRLCEMVQDAGRSLLRRDVPCPNLVITEDAKLGFILLQRILDAATVVSAEGKSRLGMCVRRCKGRPLVVFDSCGIGYDWGRLKELAQGGYCTLFDSTSLEHEILSTTFTQYFTEFTMQHALQSDSAEEYYTQQLSNVLNKLFGIAYNKADSRLADLLENGIARFHSGVMRLRDVGCTPSKTYPELRQRSADTFVGVNPMKL